ncbi:response regulator transcription factor [Dyadobacter luticola]|uniref:Response regulator transcription factor n=1 Tax=Dyadobacter luticola TaxID=1979387 RepID=A0A5R9L5G0_9BACT|nr:response regulator transcription factor [Dyadobacter luticola]TLV03641.1 response regulator transcription factor [Dyadobacter luticola]
MNVVLLDESLLLASALQNLLLTSPEIDAVDFYTDVKDFFERHRTSKPDVLVVDLVLPGLDGAEVLETCRTILGNDAKILVFSPVTDVHTIKHTIKRGAAGIISKAATYAEFQDAVIQIGSGKQYIGSDLRDNLINSVFGDEQVIYHLSPREKEVLQKVCSGRTIKEIAYELKLSAHTVQYYHRSVMEKFKVKRTTDLIVYAIQHKLYIPEK